MKNVIEETTRLMLNGTLPKEEADKILLALHNVVRCASCDNNNDFSETGKQQICIEGEYRYVTATTCNKCGKAVEIDFFD